MAHLSPSAGEGNICRLMGNFATSFCTKDYFAPNLQSNRALGYRGDLGLREPSARGVNGIFSCQRATRDEGNGKKWDQRDPHKIHALESWLISF